MELYIPEQQSCCIKFNSSERLCYWDCWAIKATTRAMVEQSSRSPDNGRAEKMLLRALLPGVSVMEHPNPHLPLGRSWILTRRCLSLSRKSQKASTTCSGCRVFLKLVLQVPLALWGCGGEEGRKRRSLVSLYLDQKIDSKGRARGSSVELALGAKYCWSAWWVPSHCLFPRGSQPEPPFPGHKTCLVLAGIPLSLSTNRVSDGREMGQESRQDPMGRRQLSLGKGKAPFPTNAGLPQHPNRRQPDFGVLCLPNEEPSSSP